MMHEEHDGQLSIIAMQYPTRQLSAIADYIARNGIYGWTAGEALMLNSKYLDPNYTYLQKVVGSGGKADYKVENECEHAFYSIVDLGRYYSKRMSSTGQSWPELEQKIEAVGLRGKYLNSAQDKPFLQFVVDQLALYGGCIVNETKIKFLYAAQQEASSQIRLTKHYTTCTSVSDLKKYTKNWTKNWLDEHLDEHLMGHGPAFNPLLEYRVLNLMNQVTLNLPADELADYRFRQWLAIDLRLIG